MDINHILEREQVSLHNARIATSSPSRIAHEQLAAAYGALLTDSDFPHRSKTTNHDAGTKQQVNEWENEGGAAAAEDSEGIKGEQSLVFV